MTGHARAGILSRLADKFPGHRPNPGHLGGYEGDLIQEPGTEEADQTLTWRPGNGEAAETRKELAAGYASAATDHDVAWYGYAGATRFDNPPQHARRYVSAIPSVIADLGGCLVGKTRRAQTDLCCRLCRAGAGQTACAHCAHFSPCVTCRFVKRQGACED